MTPDFVVDVGNTRIKVGIVRERRVAEVEYYGFNPHLWIFDQSAVERWCVSGVNPSPRDLFALMVKRTRNEVTTIDDFRRLPIAPAVDFPERVGIDRLLGAVAANRLRRPIAAAITVDAGTATTINLVSADGVFRGGFILPGLRLMAASLHSGTAQLPEIDFDGPCNFPGRNTDDAIRGGIIASTCGAIRRAIREVKRTDAEVDLFITGGASAHLMHDLAEFAPRFVPNLVLDGLLETAEALP